MWFKGEKIVILHLTNLEYPLKIVFAVAMFVFICCVLINEDASMFPKPPPSRYTTNKNCTLIYWR